MYKQRLFCFPTHSFAKLNGIDSTRSELSARPPPARGADPCPDRSPQRDAGPRAVGPPAPNAGVSAHLRRLEPSDLTSDRGRRTGPARGHSTGPDERAVLAARTPSHSRLWRHGHLVWRRRQLSLVMALHASVGEFGREALVAGRAEDDDGSECRCVRTQARERGFESERRRWSTAVINSVNVMRFMSLRRLRF